MSDWKETKVNVRDCSAQTKPDEQAEEFEIVDKLRRLYFCWDSKVSSVVDARKITSFCQIRDVSTNSGRVWHDRQSTLTLASTDSHDVPDASTRLAAAQEVEVGTTGTCSNPLSHVRRHRATAKCLRN